MRQLIQQLNMLLAAALLLAGNLVAAVEVDALYQADVSAEQSQRQWQRNALAQVITRLTGITDFSAYPAITTELNNASRYVKQFESQRHNGDSRLKVLLDATLINLLLQQQSIAIWGAHRPELLVWIVQQQEGDRVFLRQPDHELVAMLLQNLTENGIPVTLPLYDMDDLLQLTETDIWAGFWQPINQASVRYRPDMVMTVALDSVNRNGETLQRLNWQRQSPVQGSNQTRIVRNEVTAADHVELMKAFSAVLTNELAAEQAVMLQSSTQTYQLAVENLHSLADVVAVERLLGRVLGVASVTLSQFSANKAQFAVELQIELAQLKRILQWEPAMVMTDNQADEMRRGDPANSLAVEQTALNLAAVQADASYIFTKR